MNRTNIPYLTHTWSPMHGCSPIAVGCKNCWARGMSKRLAGMGVKGYDPADPFKVVCDESKLSEPLKVKRAARIGVSFMGDLFHDDVPRPFIDRVWNIMADCRQHTFLVLTKRPVRAARELGTMGWRPRWPLPNVHLGTSFSTQADLDANLPELLRCPATVRWLSLEPLLEAVDMCLRIMPPAGSDLPATDWPLVDAVIVGCESGPNRRPCKQESVESVVEQCDDAGIPVYVKQLDLDGRVSTNMDEWPEWAQRQELP